MLSKKYIYLFISFLLLIGSLPLTGIEAHAESDVTPPTLVSIDIDKRDVTGGDTIKVIAEVEDNISGVKYVSLNYESPNATTSKWLSLKLNDEGKYEGSITIGPNDPEGEWKLDFVSVQDQVGNGKYLYHEDMPQNIDFTVTGTISDISAPELKSIEIDRKEVSPGEVVTITAEVEDDISGVKYVSLNYVSPNATTSKWLSLKLNDEGKYEGSITIGQNDPEGEWKLDFVSVQDQVGNGKNLHNEDMPQNIDFTVTGTISDISAPELKSIEIDRKEVSPGEVVTITAEVEDDISGVKYVSLNYESPNATTSKWLSLKLNDEGKYEGSITIGQNDPEGEWKLDFVSVQDQVDNGKYLHNEDMPQNIDFTVIGDQDFTAISPLTEKYITVNTTWSNEYIDGDVYIGPNAVLTINGSVTVTGNIYVLGAIKNYGNLNVSGTIYATSFSWGLSILSNGTVLMLGGNNSISGMNSSNQPITDMPLMIEPESLIAENGIIPTINGATLPIMDLFLEGNKVELNNDGTFKVDNLHIGDKEKITFEFIDVLDNSIIKEYSVEVVDSTTPSVNVISGTLIKGTEVVPDVWVSARTVEGDTWFDTKTTTEGKFEFNLPDGEYVIQGIWVDEEGKWYEKPVQFKIMNGQLEGSTELGIDLLGDTLPSIIGHIQKGTAVVPNVWVSVRTIEGDIWYDTKTDSEGKFEFNLPDGEYVIQGIWVDTEGKWYEKPVQFNIINGQLEGSTELGIDLLKEDNIEPTVIGQVNKGTEAVPDVWVSSRTVEGDIWYDTKTNAEGEFEYNLPDGEYIIQGIWVDEEEKWYEKPVQFKIINGQLEGSTELGIDLLSIEDKLSSITGHINKGNKAVSDVWVSAKTVDGDIWYDTKTDAKGKFEFNLPSGEYLIQGIWVDEEENWYEKPTQFNIINGQLEGSAELGIDLLEEDNIQPTVIGYVNKGTEVIPDVWVSARTVEGDTWYDTKTTAEGKFEFNLPDGEYVIQGIWVDSEFKWHEVSTLFRVIDGQLEGLTDLQINL